MPLLVALLLVGPAILSAGGTDGIDFIYYSVNSTEKAQELATGVELKRWTDVNPFGTTAARLEFAKGAQLPENGKTGFPNTDCYVLVMEGAVSFGKAVDNGGLFYAGDLLWISAGTDLQMASTKGNQSALTLLCNGPWQLVAKTLNIAQTAVSTLLNKTVLAFHKNTTTKTLPDACRFAYPGAFALADSVDWVGGRGFPPHYHPRGSFYAVMTGKLVYGGDRDGEVAITNGDIRWVRPGWYYTEERTDQYGSSFLALHTSVANLDTDAIINQDFVSWTRPPHGPFRVQFQATASRTFAEQPRLADQRRAVHV